MAAPQNNTNALGNSGGKQGRSGRPSAYVEKNTANLLRDIFYNPYNKKELQKKIKSGTYSLEEMLIYKRLLFKEIS